ncbi:MAG: hypothetical protein AB2712_09460 [Candidatus Thiodiazotropha sp.]
MKRRKRYKKRAGAAISAVRLDLDTDGFSYRKWGGVQRCKQGDWLVDNGGDIYTVDADTFADTYAEISPGRYIKTAEVWANIAESDGVIQTLEGETHYAAGDYIVYNDEAGADGYAVGREEFESMYEPC